MKYRLSIIYAIISTLFICSFQSYSQQGNLISPYFQLQFFKNSDNIKFLQATLTYSLNRMEVPISGMEVSFFCGSDDKELLGTAFTDIKGIARYQLNDSLLLPVNREGMWDFGIEFKGNDTIEAASSELSVKDVQLEMILQMVDSVKTVLIKAVTMDKNKNIPVMGEVVVVYVPRMFSLLPVGEATLDEKGEASLEFPSDIPGDKDGNITVISKFDENPTFGNVEKQSVIKWGIPMSSSGPITHRALWTKTPPMWMIITLSVLLTGVWGHYLFAIISLILIKRDSKKHKKSKN